MANIHFVAQSFTSKMAVVPDMLKQEKASNLLVSFESTNTIAKLDKILCNFDYPCDVIIDSGAFAVYNSGKKNQHKRLFKLHQRDFTVKYYSPI